MLRALAISAVIGATAAAQAPTDSTTKVGPNNDPNQIVCVNERITGSRVAQRRVCRTRQEWEEHRAEMRTTVNEFQNFKPVLCTQPGEGTRNVC